MFSIFWDSISILGFPILIVPVFERLLAITLHVGFSVLIWNGFQLNKRFHYLLMAILAHGMVDALIPLGGKLGWGVLAMEGIVAVFAGLSLIYVFHSRKYYKEEISHE